MHDRVGGDDHRRRRIARTRLQLLSTRQYQWLTSVLDADEHLAVKIAYVIYRKIIAAYADPNRRRGKQTMTKLIESIRRGVAAGVDEIAQLGRTLWRRRDDIPAFFVLVGEHWSRRSPLRRADVRHWFRGRPFRGFNSNRYNPNRSLCAQLSPMILPSSARVLIPSLR